MKLELYNSITRENLTVFMTLFYTKALKDKLLGPFFVHELGDDMQNDDWLEHIDLLADFWLTQLNGEDTYYGNFIGAHIKVSHITEESFVVWLELFFTSSK
ncbi:MAG: group III truncated hemoglobin [Sulfurimonas sp.]|nr:group III truncated hemoglobin [Sulfurimonas sp.]